MTNAERNLSVRPAHGRRVSMRDVASASGVSLATVSFVLNKAPGQTISSATQERVERAAERLGYVPHGIARALREGSSRIVVLNISSGLEGTYSQSYIHGLGEELSHHGHVLLVQHREVTPEGRQQVLDTISPKAVITFAERYLEGYEPDEEEWDHGFAGHMATQVEHLAERGHTRLAVAIPAGRPPLSDLRLATARQVARRLDLGRVQRLVVDDRSRPAAAAGLRAFRRRHPEVTGFAAFLDDTGLRVIQAAGDLDLDVPGDVAVIGYDATAYAALSSPTLTTVLIDAEAHGRLAARDLLGLDAADLRPRPATVLRGEST